MSQDPPRLGDDARSSHELTRALRALQGEHDDRARVARVGERIAPILDAPGLPGGGLRALLVRRVAWLLLGGGAGLVGLWMAARPPAPAPRPHEPSAPLAAPEQLTVHRAQGAQVPDVIALDAQPVAPPSEPARAAAARTTPAPLRPASAQRSRTRAPVDTRVAAPLDAPASAAPANEQPETAPATASLSATEERAPAPSVAEAPRDAGAPAPKASSEFELLQRARADLTRAPGAALALLDEHVQRYPSGMLAPEREVLAIEALRALGRDADAERRLQAFRARYPHSLHLRRLERRAR